LLAGELAGVQPVTRVEVEDSPSLYAVEIERLDRPDLSATR
jgi:hypothetical protein